jgi:hypothetical protein
MTRTIPTHRRHRIMSGESRVVLAECGWALRFQVFSVATLPALPLIDIQDVQVKNERCTDDV